MTFPAQIKQLRLALHLTQVELGALLDVSAQSICNWERGRSLPWEKDREGYLSKLRNGPTVNPAYTRMLAFCGQDGSGSAFTRDEQPRPRRRIGDDL